MEVVVFYKFLIVAAMSLPTCAQVRNTTVYRGLKWVFPNGKEHDPAKHFPTGRKFQWFEPKSTSLKAATLDEEMFCGTNGPRTAFYVQLSNEACAFDIGSF